MKRVLTGSCLLLCLVLLSGVPAVAHDQSKKQCLRQAKSEFKSCKATCAESFKDSKESCIGECDQSCHAEYQGCVKPYDDALSACKQLCHDTRAQEVEACRATIGCGSQCSTNEAFLTCRLDAGTQDYVCSRTCAINQKLDSAVQAALQMCRIARRSCHQDCKNQPPPQQNN